MHPNADEHLWYPEDLPQRHSEWMLWHGTGRVLWIHPAPGRWLQSHPGLKRGEGGKGKELGTQVCERSGVFRGTQGVGPPRF